MYRVARHRNAWTIPVPLTCDTAGRTAQVFGILLGAGGEGASRFAISTGPTPRPDFQIFEISDFRFRPAGQSAFGPVFTGLFSHLLRTYRTH